jgi:hypothetical protein
LGERGEETKGPARAGLSHWKYLDQLEYERPILKRLIRQIFGLRHDLKRFDLIELGGGDDLSA